MILTLWTLLVFALIAGAVCFIARALIAAFGLRAPWANLVYAIVVLLVLLTFLSEIGFLGAPHGWRRF